MTDVTLTTNQTRGMQIAQRRIEGFAKQFGEAHRNLARHAAFPLSLTPDLLYQIWANFVPEAPWTAVAHVLLSRLCRQVGYEMYEMDISDRNLLLRELKEQFGQERFDELGEFLLDYVAKRLTDDDQDTQDLREAAEWTVLAYTKPSEAAQELARALSDKVKGAKLEDMGEVLRLTSLVETVAEPLTEEGFVPLLVYSNAMVMFARGDLQGAMSQLNTLLAEDNSIKVAGVTLPLPEWSQIDESNSAEKEQDDKLILTSGKSNGSRFVQSLIKRDTLRQCLSNIQEEYQTVNKQIDTEIDNANRERLQRKASSLFEEMQKIEKEINQLDLDNSWENSETLTSPQLQVFNFEIVKLRVEKNDRGSPEIQINKRPGQARFFVEKSPFDVNLEMVEIPGGTFRMGASEDEKGSSKDERPRHQVTVQPFFMGKYTVTQEQWEKVADFLPKVNRELKPHPSRFKGDQRPVERVSWYDVEEFCLRLSKYTKKEYRLPSEAEWEYACRAGTATPFHFGETITTQLANYDGNRIYGDGIKGEYRQQTTEVGSFPSNAFGLYDMHGNVWEWCGDRWHHTYNGAPINGVAWVDGNDNLQIQRGGSWNSNPEDCRSACRFYLNPDDVNDAIGFRVVCVVLPRTFSP